MKILVLGGTVFLGRHVIEAALKQGHEVTLFHRGVHGPELYPELEHLQGDRRGDLQALRGRSWDVVIDTNGYVPSVVAATARLLAPQIGQYVFISSISVYPDVSVMGLDESASTGQLTPEQIAQAESIQPPANGTVAIAYGEHYGTLKALCERTIEEIMPGRTLNVRLGLLIGPYDYSDRFTYWPGRIARGGEVLAPGRPQRPLQMIDVRDAAEWIMRMVERKQSGTYNVTSPAGTHTMQQILETCQAISESQARLTWVEDAFLLQEKIQPWGQMPLWLPEEPEMAGFNAISTARAEDRGLTLRPLAETAHDTLAWDLTRPANEERRAGLAPQDEERVLQAWKARA